MKSTGIFIFIYIGIIPYHYISPSMSAQRRNNEQLAVFTRQANILRKNLTEWDRMLRTPRGEDWPTMVGRLNAASVCTSLKCGMSSHDNTFNARDSSQ